MYRHLFRNRWAALGFVAMMVTSAISLVGTEEGGGMIDEAKAELQGQKQDFEDQATELAKPTSSMTVIDKSELDGGDLDEDVSDDDLVDPGTGEDPTPPDDGALEPVPDLDPTPVE